MAAAPDPRAAVGAGFEELFSRELELCRVGPGQVVGILTENGANEEYAADFAAAAGRVGAQAFRLDLPLAVPRGETEIGARSTPGGLGTITPALGALSSCDLVVDLTFLLFTPELDEIRAGGARVLTALTPPEVVERLFPDEDLRRRGKLSEEILGAAETLRVSSAAGTDLRYELGQFKPFSQYGMAEEAGRWDYFGSGLAVANPNDGGVEGHLVLCPGDIVFPWKRELRETIEIEVGGGRVTAIAGGAEAEEMSSFMAGFDDERAYAIAHVGWGLHGAATWDPTSELDPRSFLASTMFSTGPNVEFGGDNDTPCHIDIPMRGCSIEVDGDQITSEDEFVVGDLQPRSAGAAG